MAKRWRREPSSKATVWRFQERGYELRENGKTLIHVAQCLSNFPNRKILGWYWYGYGQNTAHAPVATVQEAKDQAMEWIKKNVPKPEKAGRATQA